MYKFLFGMDEDSPEGLFNQKDKNYVSLMVCICMLNKQVPVVHFISYWAISDVLWGHMYVLRNCCPKLMEFCEHQSEFEQIWYLKRLICRVHPKCL